MLIVKTEQILEHNLRSDFEKDIPFINDFYLSSTYFHYIFLGIFTQVSVIIEDAYFSPFQGPII